MVWKYIIEYAVPILMIVGFVTAYKAYKDADDKEQGYREALKKVAYWIIGWNLLGAFFVFNLNPQGVADSIGFTNCQFIRELGFYHLAMGVVTLYALQENWSLDAIKALVLIWCIFATMAGTYHAYEAYAYQNFAWNNVMGIVMDYVSSGIMLFLAIKAKTV